MNQFRVDIMELQQVIAKLMQMNIYLIVKIIWIVQLARQIQTANGSIHHQDLDHNQAHALDL
jgi:hypothetical protein